MLASPGTIGKAPSLTTVDLDVSDVVAVTFFMGSAAAPLTAVARVIPTSRAVTDLTGVSLCVTGRSGRTCAVPGRLRCNSPSHHQYGCVLWLYSTLTGRPVGFGASWVASSATTNSVCERGWGFGAAATLACNSFRRFPGVTAAVR